MHHYLTPVTRDQLVVGKRYADNDEIDEYVTILEYVKSDNVGDPLFKYVSGLDIYGYGSDWLIPFFSDKIFYELPTDHPDYR